MDRWYLRTRADLLLDGNSFGGNFLDTTTDHDGPRRVLQRVHFTTACNRGQKPDTFNVQLNPSRAGEPEKRSVRLPRAEEMQRQTMCGTGARGFRSAEELPQLPRLPSGCTMEGFSIEPLGRGKKKLKSVSADTRYAKRGLGRGGPKFWPENSFGMSQTMTNLHGFS